MSVKITARIGMVNFINTAALYEVWKDTVHRAEWQVVEAAPVELNRLLHDGSLDLGFVSSYEYAEHPDRYQILPDLSISSTGAVGSVFLFSEVEPHLLTDRVVCLSAQSKTSNALIKIILEDFYGARPTYHLPSEVGEHQEGMAVLAIGDHALRLKRQGRFPFVLDLGEVWQRNTGLPFVFAVWAVRQEFCLDHAACLGEIHQELLRCVELGRQHLSEVSRRVAPRVPMDAADCLTYLQGIELDLGQDKRQGLTLFYEHLIRRGEAHFQALPLKIYHAVD